MTLGINSTLQRSPRDMLAGIAGVGVFIIVSSTLGAAPAAGYSAVSETRQVNKTAGRSRGEELVSSPWLYAGEQSKPYELGQHQRDEWMLWATSEIARRQASDDAYAASSMAGAVESMVSLLALLPADARPTLMFDDDGIANFAAARDGLYFHLTIDSADRISWIGEKDGVEYEVEDVAFDGSELPEDLRSLLI